MSSYTFQTLSEYFLHLVQQSRVETKNIPVFFLTGQTDADTIRECLALHPAGYIVKPVAKTALLDKMKEVLG